MFAFLPFFSCAIAITSTEVLHCYFCNVDPSVVVTGVTVMPVVASKVPEVISGPAVDPMIFVIAAGALLVVVVLGCVAYCCEVLQGQLKFH